MTKETRGLRVHFRMVDMFCIRPRSQSYFNDTSERSLSLLDKCLSDRSHSRTGQPFEKDMLLVRHLKFILSIQWTTHRTRLSHFFRCV